jgi:hypothetical protein
MTESRFFPAVPGWYVEETDDGETSLDPVIAWTVATDADGEILLPAVDAGRGAPPFFLTADSFKYLNRCVVYRPNHDPGQTS